MDWAKFFDEVDEKWMREAREKAHVEGCEQGRQEGRQEGLAPLLRQIQRRLGRALSDQEHQTVAARLDTLGPDRLGDVVLDLTPGALAAWVADPDAR